MAIMVTPKLANLPDVTTTTPSDGQVLTYDDGTGQWVNEAVPAGVTDHGALTGLGDDDHTQYLLATGARTGGSAAAQPFTVGISLTDTTTSTTGVVYKGADRFIHNFHHPTGGTAVPVGNNTFIGVNAGNFTTGSTASVITEASSNTGVGVAALSSLTTGYGNVATGHLALERCTTGYYNMAIGTAALRFATTGFNNSGIGINTLLNLTTGSTNTAIGYQAMSAGTVTGTGNVAIGNGPLNNVSSGGFNVAAGWLAGLNVTTGSSNVMLGNTAARYQADGATSLTTPNNSVYIGALSRGYSNSDSNSIVIGYAAIGAGANTTVIGSTSTTAAIIYGAGKFWLRSAATNAVTNIGTLTHNSTGTPAAGFGAGILFQLETTTTEDQDAARISAVWSDATHATRTGDLVFSTVSGGAALSEKLRLTGAGILKFSGTMGDSTKTVGTDAPADWVQIDIGGTTYYLPAYAA